MTALGTPLTLDEIYKLYENKKKREFIISLVVGAILFCFLYLALYLGTDDNGNTVDLMELSFWRGISVVIIFLFSFFSIVSWFFGMIKFLFTFRGDTNYRECTPEEIDNFLALTRNKETRDFAEGINKLNRKPYYFELIEVNEYLQTIDDNTPYEDFKKITSEDN